MTRLSQHWGKKVCIIKAQGAKKAQAGLFGKKRSGGSQMKKLVLGKGGFLVWGNREG